MTRKQALKMADEKKKQADYNQQMAKTYKSISDILEAYPDLTIADYLKMQMDSKAKGVVIL